ncbi:MAG TPA: YkgJ family cysteine cluster protein [Blastocatellia bacterium]|nr:YkgJ family cysteine cluster protein [Blastocatellia bacterium]
MNVTDADQPIRPTPVAAARLVQLTRKRGMSEAHFAEMLAQLGQRRAGVVVADEATDRLAETVAESLFELSVEALPDCLTCGACCAFFHQIAVLDRDPTPRRLTWMVWEAGEVSGPKTRWLRREPDRGHCIAFTGSVGEHARCAIYELRPTSCRAFEAGSDRCRAVRRAYGLEPPMSGLEWAEYAKRLRADDLSAELNHVETLNDRKAASFSGRDRLTLLGEMIDYNCAGLAEIFREAERLQSLLIGKESAAITTDAARRVNAINGELRAVTTAIARLPLIESLEPFDAAQIERASDDFLKVAAQSQAALERAARWLQAIGEEVFATFAMPLAIW